MDKSYVVKTNSLTKKYKDIVALNHADIQIPRGSIYGLVGNNGAGKTTFLKILAGHIYQSEGEFTLLGAETEKEYKKARKRCGTIIENPGFFPMMSAKQNLEYYRIQRGIPGKEVVFNVLEQVGLEEATNRKFAKMSLGMKQRLGLALALMGEPELLILDEPINGLDPSGIIEIRNLLLKLNREKNVTILISSHILTELENVATDYGFLNKGVLVEQITAKKLHEKCCSYLEVKVTDTKKYVALLESELHCTDYKVMPDKSVQINVDVDDIVKYSTLAAKHEIGIIAFDRKEINLENYYMNIINA